jgi:uncharacterized protein (TIGR02145 family)
MYIYVKGYQISNTMKINLEQYGIKKIIPSELELRGYLSQYCQFIDKRSFIEESAEIVDYIESIGFEYYEISKIPFEIVKSIMSKFNILPDCLYFSIIDQFANYDSPNFGIIINEYKIEDIEIESDFLEEPNSDNEDYLIEYLPKFYNALQEVELVNGKFLIAYSVGNQLLDIYNKNGIPLLLDGVDSWRESDYITSCKITLDKKSILINFLGRVDSWAIFEYDNHTFIYKNSGDGHSESAPSNYYLPEEVDIHINKQFIENERVSKMPFSVIIGSQEWTTRNLETVHFCNGDPIKEASSEEAWELAAQSETPAWCYYKNNINNGQKYGKLYNWYAVNDIRGLAPEGWHIPTLKEWELLSNFLGDDCNERLKGGDDWKLYEKKADFFQVFFDNMEELENNEEDSSQFSQFNNTGFTALSGGARGEFGNAFFAMRDSAYWWTSSPVDEEDPFSQTQAYFILLYAHNISLQIGGFSDKKAGYSIRCIRNK